MFFIPVRTWEAPYGDKTLLLVMVSSVFHPRTDLRSPVRGKTSRNNNLQILKFSNLRIWDLDFDWIGGSNRLNPLIRYQSSLVTYLHPRCGKLKTMSLHIEDEKYFASKHAGGHVRSDLGGRESHPRCGKLR